MKYIKKPIVIEAVQWDGSNRREVFEFCNKGLYPEMNSNAFHDGCVLVIRTLEGEMIASIGDWIIKGVNGEFYPCKPDIFEKTYESVEVSE